MATGSTNLCSCSEEMAIVDLPYSCADKICKSLDTLRGWECLAAECDYTLDQVQQFDYEGQKTCQSPSRNLLADLGTRNLKVDYLYAKLNKCDRRREMNYLVEYVKIKCKCGQMSSGFNKTCSPASGTPTVDINNTGGTYIPDEENMELYNHRQKYPPMPKLPVKPMLNPVEHEDVNCMSQQPKMKMHKKKLECVPETQVNMEMAASKNPSYESMSSSDSNISSNTQVSFSPEVPSKQLLTSTSPSSMSKNSNRLNSSGVLCQAQKVQKSLSLEDNVDMFVSSTSLNPDLQPELGDISQFTYEDLSLATDYFSPNNKIGEGAFGVVYKGCIKDYSIAVKKIVFKPDQEKNKLFRNQFLKEIETLQKCIHKNIVPFHGYVMEDSIVCFVYTLMQNGTVEDRLQCKRNTPVLSWDTRINIALGAARGIEYLHTMDPEPLIHGDIKSANIFLDENMEAKIGDLGLAKRAAPGTGMSESGMDTKLYGTKGYLPPEFYSGNISVHTDTYSFGVVLFELYTGQKACDDKRQQTLLVDYIRSRIPDEDFEKAINLKDSKMEVQPWAIWSLQRMMGLGYLCTEEKDRPSMVQVFERLEEFAEAWNDCTLVNTTADDLIQPSCIPCLNSISSYASHHTIPDDSKNSLGSYPDKMISLHSRGVNSTRLRLVLIGRTGDGKSASGNTILGKRLFKSTFSAVPVTQFCETGTTDWLGKQICVIDTPGFIQEHLENRTALLEKLTKSIFMNDEGVSAFILVIRPDRCTQELQDIIDLIFKMFGKEVLKYMVILFTRKDELDHENMTVEEFIAGSPQWLQDFLKKIENRYLSITNRGSREDGILHTKLLIDMVEKIMECNRGECYTHSKFMQAKMCRDDECREQEILQISYDSNEGKIKRKENAEKEVKKDVCRRQARFGTVLQWIHPQRIMLFVARIFRVLWQYIYPT